MQYLSGDEDGHAAVVNRLATYPASMGVHKPPFCCLAPWQMGAEFVIKCKTGVFQYVVVRFFNCILTMVLFTLGLYKEGSYAITQPFIWITVVNFCSQSWALYSLFLFFLCAHKELHGMRPFSKFVCIKLIIFFSWWQALLIGIMVRVGRINQGYGHSAQEIAVFIRATLISAEMVVAAVAFMYAFPASEFTLLTGKHRSGSKKWSSKSSSSKRSVSSKGYLKLLSGSMHVTKKSDILPVSDKTRSARSQEQGTQPLAQKLLQQASRVLEYWGAATKTSDAASAGAATQHLGLSPAAAGTTKQSKPRPRRDQQTAWAKKNTVSGSCDSLGSLLATHREKNKENVDAAQAEAEAEVGHVSTPGREIIMPGVIRAMSSSDSEKEHAPLRPLRASSVKQKPHLQQLQQRETGNERGTVPAEECMLGEDEELGFEQDRHHVPPISPQRAFVHYKRKGDAAFEEANLMQRASPSLTRTRRDSTPLARQLPDQRSRSFNEKAPLLNTQANTGGRHSSLPANRSLEQSFHQLSNEVPPGEVSDDNSLASSECSTDSALAAPNVPGASALDLSSLGARYKAGRSGGGDSKANRGASTVTSLLQNLWISTLPADLQEDIGDLEAQLVELYCATVPTINFKRAIKSSIATN